MNENPGFHALKIPVFSEKSDSDMDGAIGFDI